MSAMRFRALRFPYFRAGLKFETGDWLEISSHQVEDPGAPVVEGDRELLPQTAIAQLLADEAGIMAEVNVAAEGDPAWKPVSANVRASARGWLGELSKERAVAAVEAYETSRGAIHRRGSSIFEAPTAEGPSTPAPVAPIAPQDAASVSQNGSRAGEMQATGGPGGPPVNGGGAGGAPPPPPAPAPAAPRGRRQRRPR